VVLAQDEARALKHNYVGTEHLLLGLLREEEGVARRILESLHVTVEDVRAQIMRIVGEGDELQTGSIPFTPRAKRVLELALRESEALGHNAIGTEHVLLAVVRENEGVAARALLDFGADAETVRHAVLRDLRLAPSPEYEEKMRRAASAGWVGGASSSTTQAPSVGAPRFRLELGGWLLVTAAIGIGVLIGWLIWG